MIDINISLKQMIAHHNIVNNIKKKGTNESLETLLELIKKIYEFDNKVFNYGCFYDLLNIISRKTGKHHLDLFFEINDQVHTSWLEHMAYDNRISYINYVFKKEFINYKPIFHNIINEQLANRLGYFTLMVLFTDNFFTINNDNLEDSIFLRTNDQLKYTSNDITRDLDIFPYTNLNLSPQIFYLEAQDIEDVPKTELISVKNSHVINSIRFLKICSRLPDEIQRVVANRIFGSPAWNLKTIEIDRWIKFFLL